MKIIFLARRFYPLIGGVEKHVLELSKQLRAAGHTIVVITEHHNKLLFHEHMKDSGIEIYRISAGKESFIKKFILWREIWKLRHIIRNADIVHCHDVFFWYLPLRFFYPHTPVYTTFHGYESYPISKKAIIIRKITEWLSMGNICIGDFIPKWYGTKPTYVSYGAVDTKRISYKEISKKSVISATFIGRLDEQTGILIYIDAIKMIRKKYPNFRFLVVGEGKYRKKISKFAKVLGFQKNPERYFSGNHFAFVSRYLAILEAMAAKRLVFAVYDNPVKKDYLTLAPFAKYIVITDSSQELCEKIFYYLEHEEEKNKIVQSAYQWVQKQNWEAIRKLYIQLWKQ